MFVCFPGVEEEPVPRTRARSDTASATNGRVLRILIVGPDDEKQQVLDDMRSMYGRMGAKHAVSVGTTITAVENFHSPRFARAARARARDARIGGEGWWIVRGDAREGRADGTRANDDERED